ISFPIHTSPAFAKAVGLDGIILQGTATLAMAAREILDREAEQETRRLLSIGCGFTGMVRPGAAIKVRLRLRKDESNSSLLLFDVLDNTGKIVVSRGQAKIGPKDYAR
ncbi:MAG: hypothetical protein GXP54_10870, partial [Deltaproteobacteria bacterium]|nr:hypothetical protein [Deltaproteobacteria bacterium]